MILVSDSSWRYLQEATFRLPTPLSTSTYYVPATSAYVPSAHFCILGSSGGLHTGMLRACRMGCSLIAYRPAEVLVHARGANKCARPKHYRMTVTGRLCGHYYVWEQCSTMLPKRLPYALSVSH